VGASAEIKICFNALVLYHKKALQKIAIFHKVKENANQP
jgi:hypothetical protein